MKKQVPPANPGQPFDGKGLSLLTFKVAGQPYGIMISSIVRIIEMVTITALLGAPDIIQGIINVHGKAVAVIDLRRRFGLPQVPYGLHTPIILVYIDNGLNTLGLVVDSVDQVVDVLPEGLEMTETIVPAELTSSMTKEAAYLAGVAKVDRRMILVLDVKAVLAYHDQLQLSRALEHQGFSGSREV